MWDSNSGETALRFIRQAAYRPGLIPCPTVLSSSSPVCSVRTPFRTRELRFSKLTELRPRSGRN